MKAIKIDGALKNVTRVPNIRNNNSINKDLGLITLGLFICICINYIHNISRSSSRWEYLIRDLNGSNK